MVEVGRFMDSNGCEKNAQATPGACLWQLWQWQLQWYVTGLIQIPPKVQGTWFVNFKGGLGFCTANLQFLPPKNNPKHADCFALRIV